MNIKIKELFEDIKLVNKIKTKLPFLFHLAELESSSRNTKPNYEITN